MFNKLGEAIVRGLIVGIVVFIILALVSALIPRFSIDATWWGVVAGVVYGLYVFFTGKSNV